MTKDFTIPMLSFTMVSPAYAGQLLLKINVVRLVPEYCSEYFSVDISIKSAAGKVFVSERYITKMFEKKWADFFAIT